MTTEDLQKFKILASEERFRAGLRWLADFERASWPEVRDFVSSFVIPGNEFRAFLKIAAREQGNGGRRPCQMDGLADELRFEMSRKWCSLDPLSIVGAAVPPMDEGDTFPWAMLAPAYFLQPFEGDGGFLTITGRPRMGKTGIGCLLGEMWAGAHPGCEVVTNVALDGKIVPWLRPVSAMSSLLEAVADALEAERNWLWMLDEGGLVWLRAEVMTLKARGLEKFARIVPKLGGSLVYIEQRIEGVPTVLTDFAQSHVFAVRPGFASLDLPGRRCTVRAIPKPRYFRYRSGETGYFDVDVDMDKVIARLRLDEDTKRRTQAERIRGYLALVEDAARARVAPKMPREPQTG